MWMIANYLNADYSSCEIHSDMDYELFGISLTPKEGCIYVTQINDTVLCSYKQDTIVFDNCSLIDVIQKLQDTFNFYNDWQDKIITLCQSGDWQRVIDSMDPVFYKPIILFDLNQKVIAMSTKFKAGSVNEEWDYLIEYGYASNDAFRTARNSPRFFEILHTGNGIFYTPATNSTATESLTICIKSHDIPWGYITSVAVNNKYSHGEIDSLFCLAKIIEQNIPIKSEIAYNDFSINVIKEYLLNPGADNSDNLFRLIRSYGWNPSDRFCIICSYLNEAESENIHRMYATALNILDVPCISFSNSLVYVISREDKLFQNYVNQIFEISQNFSASVIISLPVPKIENIYYAYSQVEFIISKFTLQSNVLYNFYDYAIKYIISHSDQQELIFACKPEITMLINGNSKDTELLKTLEVYLLIGHSLQNASTLLHVHRNTINYRIQKAAEKKYVDFSSIYDCEYAKLSINTYRYFKYIEDVDYL